MPQSLANLPIHLIFSTKKRERFLTNEFRGSLHAYIGTVLQNLDCKAILANSVEDHIHILFNLSRTQSVSKVVEDVKKSSSRWLKTQSPVLAKFAWQSGYAAFAVSESNLQQVYEYIANQQAHHAVNTFQDEYRAFLKRHHLTFDEKYLWD